MTYPHVMPAIKEDLRHLQELEKWRKDIDLDEFAKDPVEYIRKNAPRAIEDVQDERLPLLVFAELWRYGEHFAKNETVKKRVLEEARQELKRMIVRRAAAKDGRDSRGSRCWNNLRQIVENNLEDQYESFDQLVQLVGKDEGKKKIKLNF